MNILITGGLGFVGRKLTQTFLSQGENVTAIGSNPNPKPIHHKNFAYIAADTTQPGKWQMAVQQSQLIINLAGRSIFHPWTKAYKQQMYDSRILTTRNLVEALTPKSDITLISTSAIGYCGQGGDEILTETSPMGDDFLAHLSNDWETEAFKAREKGGRVVIARFSIIFDHDGGALGVMIPAFRFLLGGKLGDGQQWFSWMHIKDLIRACTFLASRTDIDGIVNFCAPQPIRNTELTSVLAEALGRPAFMPAPKFMIKTVMGELGQVLLNSQRAIPQRLTEAGFEFEYPTLKQAISEIIDRWQQNRH